MQAQVEASFVTKPQSICKNKKYFKKIRVPFEYKNLSKKQGNQTTKTRNKAINTSPGFLLAIGLVLLPYQDKDEKGPFLL